MRIKNIKQKVNVILIVMMVFLAVYFSIGVSSSHTVHYYRVEIYAEEGMHYTVSVPRPKGVKLTDKTPNFIEGTAVIETEDVHIRGNPASLMLEGNGTVILEYTFTEHYRKNLSPFRSMGFDHRAQLDETLNGSIEVMITYQYELIRNGVGRYNRRYELEGASREEGLFRMYTMEYRYSNWKLFGGGK